MPDVEAPIEVFCSYAHKDESLLGELKAHLSVLQRQGLISTWHDRQIIPGTDWAQTIDARLETASLILLLVSSNFLASDYCYEIEMQRAIERHEAGQARVIPIIVRPCDWIYTSFARLQCLPRDGKSVTEWPNRDSAWSDVVAGIRRAIKDLSSPSLSLTTRKAENGRKTVVLPQSQSTIVQGCISRRTLVATAGVALLGGGIVWLVQSFGSPRVASAPTPAWTHNQPVQPFSQASAMAPALTVWNDILYMAFVSNDDKSRLLTVSTKNRVNWTHDQPVQPFSQASAMAPALTVWNDTLYMAFVANNSYNSLLTVSTKDGINWTDNQPVGQASQVAPALAVWNDTLYMAFVSNGDKSRLLTVSSKDGLNWTDNQPAARQASSTTPALAVWNDTLYMAFVANDGSNRLLIISTKDGVNWHNPSFVGQTSSMAPALTVWNDTLYMAFVANNRHNSLLTVSTKDGINWTDNQPVGQVSQVAPALAVWNDTLYMAFVASNSTNHLLATHRVRTPTPNATT